MHDRSAAGERELDDLAGSSSPARRLAVPDGDKHIAMGDGRPPGHDVGIEALIGVAGQLERARRVLKQRIEALAGAVVREAFPVALSSERENRLELPAELDRKFGSDLVRPVRDRRDEAQPWRPGRETVALPLQQRAAGLLDQQQRLTNALAQALDVANFERIGAMAGNSDGKDKRNRWRVRGSTFYVSSEVGWFPVQRLTPLRAKKNR